MTGWCPPPLVTFPTDAPPQPRPHTPSNACPEFLPAGKDTQMALPAAYHWLTKPQLQPLPKMVSEALKLFDVKETQGPANTPEIMHWASECGVAGYNADKIPWCGLFMAAVAKHAGKPIPNGPLWALNWGKFGQEGGQPEL